MFNRHPALSRRVLITLLSGNGIEGVLVQKIGYQYVIKGAVVHEPGVQPAAADGEIVIDAANVDYIQAFG